MTTTLQRFFPSTRISVELGFLIQFLLLCGCGSVRTVSENDTTWHARINHVSQEKTARVALADGTTYAGFALRITADSVVWRDRRDGSRQITFPGDVRAIRFVHRDKGAVAGFTYVAVPGLILGGIAEAGSEGWCCGYGAVALASAIYGLLGAAIGAGIGYHETYRFSGLSTTSSGTPADTAESVERLRVESTSRRSVRQAPVRPRLWNVKVALGPAPSAARRDLERAMEEADLDHRSPNIFGTRIGARGHPHSTLGATWTVAAERRLWRSVLNRPASLNLLFSRANMGATTGYSATEEGFLRVAYSTTTVAPFVSMDVVDWLSIGGGPAFFVAGASSEGASYSRVARRLGLLFDAGVRFPRASRMFLEARTQYRLVGSDRVGPIRSGAVVLPESRIRYDHWLFSFGTGFRF